MKIHRIHFFNSMKMLKNKIKTIKCSFETSNCFFEDLAWLKSKIRSGVLIAHNDVDVPMQCLGNLHFVPGREPGCCFDEQLYR